MKHIIGFLLIFCSLIANGQQRRDFPLNLEDFDRGLYHFGFAIGFNSSSSLLDKKADYTFTDSILSIRAIPQPGFQITLISQLHITNELKLKFTPTLSFQDRLFEYRILESDTSVKVSDQRVKSTIVTFPILIKIRTQRVNNFAAYLIGGGAYGIDMSSNKNADADKIIKLGQSHKSIIVGGGADFFLPYFKFGVELKLNLGLNDILIQENNFYTAPLDKIRAKTWSLSFTFEG